MPLSVQSNPSWAQSKKKKKKLAPCQPKVPLLPLLPHYLGAVGPDGPKVDVEVDMLLPVAHGEAPLHPGHVPVVLGKLTDVGASLLLKVHVVVVTCEYDSGHTYASVAAGMRVWIRKRSV